MAAASSSSSSDVPRKGWTYDVFLSFRGADTRKNFVEHLYAALQRNGIQTFEDDKKLGGSQPISEELVKAIKESRFVVVVFSKTYAYSWWCLEELSTIMECHKQMGGQKILPVFYHVNPNDVRKQKGEFARAFNIHQDQFRGEVDKVKKWRDALTAAANLYGLHIFPNNMGESAFINKIVEVILADKQPRGGIEPRKYDVFLSFHGDTRNNFVDHLYAALVRNGIHAFKDDEMLVFGQPISEELVKAVKESRFAVVVFSRNYIVNSRCLKELSNIMECHKQMGQRVLPVYYHINPYDVRRQKGDFATAFKNHDQYQGDEIKRWRDALTACSDLAGYDISSYAMGESESITNIVKVILADKHVETSGRQIGKLFVSDEEIYKGSNGTIVLEGTYDTRPVAVKCIVKEDHDVASEEIHNLIHSDHHPNIVRYYGVEDDDYFVYIALERCICSLHELMLPPTNPTVQLQQLTLEFGSFKLPDGYPSPELLKVMRDTVAGLAHLHKLGFTHQNLKPQNVLICKDSSISAKISSMGISSATGYGSSPGWQAPETLLHQPQTPAVDLFSLGCLLFFCITGGHHPFSDDMHDRNTNIVKDRKDLSLVDNIPEAFDLVSNLIHRDPESRPIAAEVYHHPLFWDPEMRLSFLQDASDLLKVEDRETNSDLLKALESIGTVALGGKWDDKLDSTLLSDIVRYSKYKYDSVRDLLRFIRNKSDHYHKLPKDVQAVLGPFPTGFEGYFRDRFPKLLMEVYKVLKQYCGEEESLKKYYKKRGEAAFISKIVQQISADIQPRGATRENHLVGIEPHIEALISLLKMEATKEVRIVGIWGVRGIGKTTIALALFDRIAHKFEGSSFVASVRENSSTEIDICGLQQKILEDILGEHHGYKIKDRDQGANIIQERCCRKKVLLVLDDVNDVMQLEFLAATPEEWFGPGSRIIITTRDQQLLSYEDEKYKPAALSGDQAVELFNWHAFNKTSPPEGYEELSIRAVRSTGGLPLALKILGSLLLGRPSDVWESTLDRLVEIPIQEIYDTPELCFNVVQTKKGGWTYDVFLSFRGRDTLHSFVESLYAELIWNGIRVFKDNEMLGGGQTIYEEHVKAIKESRFAVVVFSKNYTNSSLCLEELSTIMECQNQTGGLKVLPVFYHVDPSYVRNQNRDFAVAFETYEHKFKGEMNKVNKWRDAVTAAANLAGQQHISPGNGGDAIRSNLVEQISSSIQPLDASRENDLIGKEPRTDALNLSSVRKREGRWTYDVFLSFYAMDTGNNFSDHLYAALVQKRIHVFRHNYVGQTISEDVEKAIKESGFAVVVFSENYAESSLCLKELSIIMECHNQKNQRVLPVFYHVDPTDIRIPGQQGEVAFITAATSLPGPFIPRDNDGESGFVKDIVRQILDDAEIREHKFQKLYVSNKEIGKGSNDTIVLEGTYETRHVAVKRIVKKNHNDNALTEILNLSRSDHHPNIVRYYGVEDDVEFIYIALELCICSLHELILPPTNPTVESQLTLEERESFKVRESIGYPSPELLKVLRDTVAGLDHLHTHGFIHRDLKPQNVLICKYSSIRGKVSEMAIRKRLPADISSLSGTTGYGSPGWQAPELFHEEPQITNAVDLFSLGCLLFFCITGGGHPFGDDIYECDTNIMEDRKDLSSLVDIIPEAFDLVSKLIHPKPEFRPNAAEVYHHPLFWDPDTRLSFFRDASDCVELEYRVPGSHLLNALESIGTVAFGSQWDTMLDSTLLNDLKTGHHRKYTYTSVRDLLRVIRNKFNHYRDLRKDVQIVLGDVPTGFEGYFLSRFPKLLIEVYKVLKQHCGEEESLKKYYKKTLD